MTVVVSKNYDIVLGRCLFAWATTFFLSVNALRTNPTAVARQKYRILSIIYGYQILIIWRNAFNFDAWYVRPCKTTSTKIYMLKKNMKKNLTSFAQFTNQPVANVMNVHVIQYNPTLPPITTFVYQSIMTSWASSLEVIMKSSDLHSMQLLKSIGKRDIFEYPWGNQCMPWRNKAGSLAQSTLIRLHSHGSAFA